VLQRRCRSVDRVWHRLRYWREPRLRRQSRRSLDAHTGGAAEPDASFAGDAYTGIAAEPNTCKYAHAYEREHSGTDACKHTHADDLDSCSR
jgi:hypothetical protein